MVRFVKEMSKIPVQMLGFVKEMSKIPVQMVGFCLRKKPRFLRNHVFSYSGIELFTVCSVSLEAVVSYLLPSVLHFSWA